MSSGLRQRVGTAVVLAPLAIGMVLYAPTAVFALIVGAAFMLGMWEWTRLVSLRSRAARAAVVAATGILLATIWFMQSTELLVAGVALGVLWWLVALLWLRHFSFAATPTSGHCALKILVGCLMLTAAWSALVLLHDQPLGPWWTLYALALVWVADIGAYFAGRTFGHRKLAPTISPGKTWAGVWGALAGAAAFAAVAGGLGFGLDAIMLAALVGLSLASAAVSIVGDLFESLIKRHSHSKDSGSLLPGHGGIFDRIDSILAATPVFAAGKLLLNL